MRLRPQRFAASVLLVLLATSTASALPTAIDTTKIALSGLVRDGLGNGIANALVVVTPVGPFDRVRSSVTDAGGRYRFDALSHGGYRVTAIKAGYASAVVRVSSWVEKSLDLVLAPAAGGPPPPGRADWILTAPPRDILREIDAGFAVEPVSDGPGAATAEDAPETPWMGAGEGAGDDPVAEFFRYLSGEVQQSFTESQPGSGSSEAMEGGSGAKTSLLLGSPVGRRAEWDLLGQRATENTTLDASSIEGRESTGETLRAGFRYDTGGDGRLAMRAYYDYDALVFADAAELSIANAEPDRERHAWGYDAGWSGTVGPEASLEVDMRYLGSAVGGMGGRSGRRDDASIEPDYGLASETTLWRTSARVSKKVGASHKVDVGVRARLYSFGEMKGRIIAPSPSQDPSLFAEFGRDGWSVNVDAAESWSIARPLSVDLGFDVARSVFSAGHVMDTLVPQAGVSLTPDASTTVRALVSYALSKQHSPYDGSVIEAETEEPIGYRVRLERQMGPALLVTLDAQARPLYYDFIGGGWGAETSDGARGLYISDAASRVREASLALEARAFAGLTISVGTGAGHVKGRLAVSIPDGDLLRSLSEGDLRYTRARLLSKFEPSGTDLRIDLIRVGERVDGVDGEGSYHDRRVEVRILQDLAFVHPGDTDWSLLLSYQSYAPVDDETIPLGTRADARLWSSLDRISGGISVRF